MTNFQLLWNATLVLSVGVAALRGGRPEWAVAVACLLASLATPLVQLGRYEQTEIGVMLVDLTLLAVLAGVALTSNRFWPLWALGFHAVGATIHLARMAQPMIVPTAYANAAAFWSYPVLLALLFGSWNAKKLDQPPPRRSQFNRGI